MADNKSRSRYTFLAKLGLNKPKALVDAAERPTLPQELIDLILDLTDIKSLTVCARVARSFRYTSQKNIFASVRLVPPSRYRLRSKSLTLKAFSQILLDSPHLALEVHSLTVVEGTGVGSPQWMRKDAFPAVLSMLVNLTDISVECEVAMDWNSFPALVKEALHVTVALPSLVSVQLQHLSFDQSGDLTSFLQSCKHVDSLVLSSIAVRDIGGNAGLDPRLGLCSLTLGPSHLPLIHSVMSVFDMQSLWYLHATVPIPELEAEIQHLLDGTRNLEYFHVCLDHHHNTSNIDLQNLTHLRTLEITLLFDFSTAPDGFDPVGWTGNIIATSRNPSPIQHVILNVRVDERDLSYLSRLKELERFLVAPEISSLRRLTVNLHSFDVDFNVHGCEPDVRDAFPILFARGMLEMVFLGVP